MNVTLKSMFVLSLFSAILVGGSIFVSVRAQDGTETLGKDIANTFRDVIKHHQSDIENFIFETKVSVADTMEAKLDVIDFYINDTLRAEIEEVQIKREELVAALQAGEIDNKTFTMEMKDLASDLVDVAKTLGVIGDELHALSEDLAGDLKARAEQLTAELQQWAEEMASMGQAIADEMSGRDLPVPEIPERPDIPSWP
jgi:gas vesicle protein